jgi:hypothetical protein
MSSEQPEQDTTVTVPKSTLTKAGLEHSSSPDSIGPDQHIEAEEVPAPQVSLAATPVCTGY